MGIQVLLGLERGFPLRVGWAWARDLRELLLGMMVVMMMMMMMTMCLLSRFVSLWRRRDLRSGLRRPDLDLLLRRLRVSLLVRGNRLAFWDSALGLSSWVWPS